MTKLKFITVLTIILLTSCRKQSNLNYLKDNQYSININGIERTLLIDLPKDYSNKKKYSLAIILHGGGGSSESVKNFTPKVKNLEFIMVYPDGVNGNWRYNKGLSNYSDDIVFLEELVNALTTNYSIDSNRIYLGGISLGGLMTYSSGVYIPESFSAIGVISSALIPSFLKNSDNIEPLNLLHIHAIDDDVFLYEGVGLSAINSIENWKSINLSNSKHSSTDILEGITSKRWLSSKTGKSTELITYSSGGHNLLPYSSDLLIDFFYNTPPRANRATLDIASLNEHYILGEEIVLDIFIQDKSSVKEVIYTIDNIEVLSKDVINPTFNWLPKEEGVYKVGAYTILHSGERVYSPITLDILVVKPYKTGDYSATATSVEVNSLSPELTIDGDLSTRWASKYSNDQALTIDLKKEEIINGITVVWEEAYAQSYYLEYSKDKINWISMKSEMDAPGPDYFPLKGVNTRYIRVKGEKRGTPWGYSIYEILIH